MKYVTSEHDFETTLQRFTNELKQRGITLFATIDHQKNAIEADLKMNPLTVFIFGNAKVGTKLMQEDPDVGIDLPLKVAVKKTADKVELFYKDLAQTTSHLAIKSKDLVAKMNQQLDDLVYVVAHK